MGWWSDDVDGHEGFAIALVPIDGEHENSFANFREISRTDESHTGLHHACSGCDCGWRSERISVAEPMRCERGHLLCSERVDARLERLWVEHVALVAYRLALAQYNYPVARERTSDRLVRQLESIERCECGHERRQHTLVNCTVSLCPCREFRFMPTPA
jgi:hypothetical protein